jgi:Mn2+/Fe2+ NRAMP family transporter
VTTIRPPRTKAELLRIVGPGVVVAATGVGAGDLIAAAKAGAAYGLPVLWTAVLGALLKLALAEGVGRWQLATHSTVLEGWSRVFGLPVRVYFLIYFLLWTVIVSAALMSACGLAAHALFPFFSVRLWAVVHAIAALGFVWVGGYGAVERTMKFVIAVMFTSIAGSAAMQRPPLGDTLRGLVVPWIPEDGTVLVMGIVGGIGGTLTLLSYNYWIAEKGWRGPGWVRAMRVDLTVGYVLTGIFGVAVIVLGGVVLLPNGITVSGATGVLDMAAVLGERFGRAGEIVFLTGFWGAVLSSLLGVWQGVPYLFGDYVALLRRADEDGRARAVDRRGALYRGYAVFMTVPPMLLLLLDKPVWIVVVYAAVGSLFMPFLAVTLLVMNNRSEMGRLKNGFVANAALALSLLLFVYLAVHQLYEQFRKLGA